VYSVSDTREEIAAATRIALRETPIERLPEASRACGGDLWIKRDDLTHPLYGGNKPRKLQRILADARARGATALVTAGAAGSHHVLATVIHGRAQGFDVHAVLGPQARTTHAETALRASLSQGAIVHTCPWQSLVPLWLEGTALRLSLAGTRVKRVAIGGSDAQGAAGYIDAMREVRAQIAAGAMEGRWPDVIVCANGSGGTHAGLIAARHMDEIEVRVVGVMVSIPWAIPRLRTAHLANAARRLVDPALAKRQRRITWRDVELVGDQLGEGYGRSTVEGDRATEIFARDGITLDPTYTSKTAAAAMALARALGPNRRVLYWHTLSSAPYEALVSPAFERIPPALDRLLIG
jgi:1-aminocyclopropane-1-carboxylate deaminase/D-cysteine desulfhydrase-like pyridoxal-dependent ACC family enzyme